MRYSNLRYSIPLCYKHLNFDAKICKVFLIFKSLGAILRNHQLWTLQLPIWIFALKYSRIELQRQSYRPFEFSRQKSTLFCIFNVSEGLISYRLKFRLFFRHVSNPWKIWIQNWIFRGKNIILYYILDFLVLQTFEFSR